MSNPINNVGYGVTNALQNLAAQPILSKRNPTVRDRAELGTLWVNTALNIYFVATSVAAGSTSWVAQATGAGTFAAVDITGGAGDVLTVQPGGDTVLGGTLDVAGNSVLAGNLEVQGAITTTSLGGVTAGVLAVVPATTTSAVPAATIHRNVGALTITGLTTAAAATQVITITNNKVLTTSAVLCTATNLNASLNGAAIGIQSIVQAASTLLVTLVNNGGGALGAGDNVHVNFWVLS